MQIFMASVDLNAVYSCLPADVLMVPVLMVAVDSQGNNGTGIDCG